MTRLRLEISEAAATDILEQADWYESRASGELAAAWERAVTATVLTFSNTRTPSGNELREIRISDVRRTPINDFPRHLIFYRVSDDAVLILRVLHGARDLESLFP